jgi:hypothetical protein
MAISYVESLRRFLERKEAAAGAQRTALSLRLEQAIQRLLKRFPAVTGTTLIDPFVGPQQFRPDSYVDIVIRGLSGEDYFAALALLERELQVSVNLIRQEEMPKSLRVRFKHALLLYAGQRIRNHSDAEK